MSEMGEGKNGTGYRIQNAHFEPKSNFVPLDVYPYIGYPFTGSYARYGKNLKEGIRHARGTENAGIPPFQTFS